jgi:hypothetical protein
MSGFSFTPAEPFGHVASPLTGSYVTEIGGVIADPLRGEDYPVAAACKVCGGRIRLGHKMQMEWRHAPAEAAGSAS